MRDRLALSLVLTLPVVAMSMIPALQFEHWQWLYLEIATAVTVFILAGRYFEARAKRRSAPPCGAARARRAIRALKP